MSGISLIILAAGNSSRFDYNAKKQWLRVGELPLWKFVAQKFASFYSFDKVVVTSHPDEARFMANFVVDETIVIGGNSRQASLKNALEVVESGFVMVCDVARTCVPREVFLNLIKSKDDADCIVAFVPTSDTTVVGQNRVNRDEVRLIQTPQLSKTSILKKALEGSVEFTDDSGAIDAIGGSIKYVIGSLQSAKLTKAEDLQILKCLQKPNDGYFCGFGYDVHQFENGKRMVLGGVAFESEFGFKAHSDGDVLIHSIIDALLGACGGGDIGEFFPDTNLQYKNANSIHLLEFINKFIKNVGYEICNIDVSIVAEVPKITPKKIQIKNSLARILKIEPWRINIKATTNEKMGFVGRKEGVAVYSTACLKFFDWTKGL